MKRELDPPKESGESHRARHYLCELGGFDNHSELARLSRTPR